MIYAATHEPRSTRDKACEITHDEGITPIDHGPIMDTRHTRHARRSYRQTTTRALTAAGVRRLVHGVRPQLLTLSLSVGMMGCPASDPLSDNEETGSGTQGSTASATAGFDETIADSSTTGADTDPLGMTSSNPGGSSTTTAAGGSTNAPPDSTTSPIPGRCGDNVIKGDEVCDLDQLNGETCRSLGFAGGVLACTLTCDAYNVLGCTMCGDGVIQPMEDCDGEVPRRVTCAALGFDTGEVTCGLDCLFDLSDCAICGDGVQQQPEECDGFELGGETCLSIGQGPGMLSCDFQTCTFDTSGCEMAPP